MDVFSGNSSASDEDWDAIKLNRETRYFNDFLGFSYAIPRGWWLYIANEENVGENKGDITDDVSMDIFFGSYGKYNYSTVWLLSFGNLEKSSQDNHLGFDIDARSVDGINDMSGFMKYFEAFMMEVEEDEEYKMIDSQQITINGNSFELRDYLVTQSDFRDYNILTLSCQAKNGYFLNIKVDYWADNTKAKDAILDSIKKAVEFY